MLNFAFFGTGTCDPNRDAKQMLTDIGIIIGWLLLAWGIRRLYATRMNSVLKMLCATLLVFGGLAATAAIHFIVAFSFACSR